MSKANLTELRDEFVKNIEKYEGTKKFDYYNEALARLNGFDAAVDLLTKQGVAEFDESNFKQFWIADPDRYQCFECDSLVCGSNPKDSAAYEGNTLHVIEYSAYVERTNELSGRVLSLQKENAILREVNADLIAALEYYKSNAMKFRHFDEVTPDVEDYCNGEIAEDAIKLANETLTAADEARGAK